MEITRIPYWITAAKAFGLTPNVMKLVAAKCCWLAVAALGCCIVSGCATYSDVMTHQREALKYAEQGDKAFDAKHYAEADEAYGVALTKSEAMYSSCERASDCRGNAAAYRDVRKGLLYARARARFSAGNLDGAKADLVRVLGEDPKFPPGHFFLASVYLIQGEAAEYAHEMSVLARLANDPSLGPDQRTEAKRLHDGLNKLSHKDIEAAGDAQSVHR